MASQTGSASVAPASAGDGNARRPFRFVEEKTGPVGCMTGPLFEPLPPSRIATPRHGELIHFSCPAPAPGQDGRAAQRQQRQRRRLGHLAAVIEVPKIHLPAALEISDDQ